MSVFWQRALIAVVVIVLASAASRSSSTGGSPPRRSLPAAVTRYRVLRRTIFAAIVFVGVMSALLVIPQVRAIAGGVLASSAVIGLVIGFASQRTIGNVVAGILIAFTPAAAARRRGRGRRARRASSRRSASPTRGSGPATTTGSSSRTRGSPRRRSATRRSAARRRWRRSPCRCPTMPGSARTSSSRSKSEGEEVYVSDLAGDKATHRRAQVGPRRGRPPSGRRATCASDDRGAAREGDAP